LTYDGRHDDLELRLRQRIVLCLIFRALLLRGLASWFIYFERSLGRLSKSFMGEDGLAGAFLMHLSTDQAYYIFTFEEMDTFTLQ